MNSFRLQVIFAIFIALLIGMNLLGAKIIPLFGPFSASVGIFMVPLTFLLTDIVEEVHGKKITRQFVLAGMIGIAVIMLYVALFVVLPAHERYANNDAYTAIFKSSLRIMAASIIAFLISQFHDVWSFGFWKQKTHEKLLWWRSNASTIVSQAIDTFLFMMIAFYQMTPKFTFAFVMGIAIPYFIFKAMFGSISTPLVYLGAWWLRSAKKEGDSV
ncbi:MAG: queuosine precursor transporter [Candidatus Uhrbacteria bacterium]|nr:queuosine precursor transporter [Candidatus Uhrbacteria bacterium]